MKNYEFVYIIAGDLGEEEVKKTSQKVLDLIKKNEGKILKEERWGKKSLAYPIKKQNYGFYILLNLEIEPSKIQILEKEIKLIPEILRYLFLKIELKKAIKKIVTSQKKENKTEKGIKGKAKLRVSSTKKSISVEKENMENKLKEKKEQEKKLVEEKERQKFLDKKLEEILKE